ncbi:MAG: hypothetical protein IMY69_09115 [Bacteroidetes bacterium]|nr:hypothetical protein [Bacteroidota bacterium]MCK4406714.1 hypothetical protein [Bacteroidales bacterium]
MRNESGRQITAFGAELELLSYSIHILIVMIAIYRDQDRYFGINPG